MLQQMFESPDHYQLFIAAGLGALIGLERELAGKDPSLRTFALIALGSCLFTEVSVLTLNLNHFSDPGRVAAQVVTGIGFLGAGAIFRSKQGISGLTTAALMWVTAGIGMAVGYGRADLATTATIIGLFVSLSLRVVHDILERLGLRDSKRSDTERV